MSDAHNISQIFKISKTQFISNSDKTSSVLVIITYVIIYRFRLAKNREIKYILVFKVITIYLKCIGQKKRHSTIWCI